MSIYFTLNIKDRDIEVEIDYWLSNTPGNTFALPEDSYDDDTEFEITGWTVVEELPVDIDDAAIQKAVEAADQEIFEKAMEQI